MKDILDRKDILPDGRAPRNVRKFIERVGGRNPYGEPNYRLVLTESVLQFRGGVWHDWPEGTEIEDQGGLTFSDETAISEILTKIPGTDQELLTGVEMPTGIGLSSQAPIRIVPEMRWIRRYPNIHGWMLQHWDPPALYGSKTEWESHRVPGNQDLMILGPFPEKGDYEQSAEWCEAGDGGITVHNPTLPEIPALSRLEEAIEQREYRRNNDPMSANPAWRALTRTLELRAQQEAEQKKRIEYFQRYYRDKMKAYFGSSLGAGRLREALAKRAGMRLGHVGN